MSLLKRFTVNIRFNLLSCITFVIREQDMTIDLTEDTNSRSSSVLSETNSNDIFSLTV